MKKAFALLLCAVMLLALCACGSEKKLIGTWVYDEALEEDETKENLEYLDFYDDEIACADLTACSFHRYVVFNEDKTYEMGYDEETSVANIKWYLSDLMNALYENKDSIEEYDGYFADVTSAEEFLEEYASEFYGFESGDAMLQEMAETVYSWYDLPTETGIWKASSSSIGFEIDGESEYEYAGYETGDGWLRIEFADGDVSFRIN